MKKKSKTNSKYSLLKVIGISFIFFAILTWIIPTGTISTSGTYTESTSGTAPVGLIGLFIDPIYSLGIFAQYFALLLCVGGFYGVLNKTGAYNKIVVSLGNKVKEHKAIWLTVVTVLLALISSFVGNQIALFLLVPFFVAVLMQGGFNKVTSLAATAGAILVGVAGSIFGNDVIYISFFGSDIFEGTMTKVIFFIILTCLYVLFLLFQSKLIFNKNKKAKEEIEEKDIPLMTSKSTDKSVMPLIVICVLLLAIIVLGCINWNYTFNITLFTELSTKIEEMTWLTKLLGYVPTFGYFGNYDVAAMILLFTFLVKWLYSVKFDEFIDGFVEGLKAMFWPAVYAILASTIFAVMVNTSDGASISVTISNYILSINDKLYVLAVTLLGFVGGFFFNDLPYLTNSMYSLLGNYGSASTEVMGILLQSGYALGMLCLPVSVVLVTGLKYLNVSYKEWLKYIYKFLLLMFVITIIFGLIALAL